MKQFKLVLLCIGILAGVCITSICMGQGPKKLELEENVSYTNYNNTVKVDFKVFINDELGKNKKVSFRFINTEHDIDMTQHMSSEFTMLLAYNEHYKFEISVDGTNKKTLEIDTKAPTDRWLLTCNIFLYENAPDEYTGKLVYDNVKDTFKHIK